MSNVVYVKTKSVILHSPVSLTLSLSDLVLTRASSQLSFISSSSAVWSIFEDKLTSPNCWDFIYYSASTIALADIRTAWDDRTNRESKCHATVIIALDIFQESPLLFKQWIMYIIPFANYRWSLGQVDTKGTDSLASSNRGRSVFILLLKNLTCMCFFLYKDILWFDNYKLRNISSQVEFLFQFTKNTKRD